MAHSVDVVVEHDYTAADDQELTLKKGDIIRCVEQKSDGWWKGELRGRVGLFPDNFVRLLSNIQDANEQSLRNALPRFCRAMFSYSQANHDELNLAVGDIIQVLGEVEEGWWRGQRNDEVGVFPSNFVVAYDATPPLPPKPVRPQCKVLYGYTAANSDELTLKEGDIVTIISKEVPDQGWWRGELHGRIGLFPDNFVTEVPLHHQSDVDSNKKPARPVKNLSSASQMRSPLMSANKKDLKPGSQSNIAAARKSLEMNDMNIDNASIKSRKIAENYDSNIDMASLKSKKLVENDMSEKKSRRSVEPESTSGIKPPIPVKKAGSPVVAMLSELRQKVSDYRSSSQPSSDTADGALSSKPSGEPILTSISPSRSPIPPSTALSTSPNMSESFDQIERSSILNDLRSARVRGPPRRPPSQSHRDDTPLTNGSCHNSSTDSVGENEIKPKAREWEKQKAPWMEELKFNQAKKTSPISEVGRSKTVASSDGMSCEKIDVPRTRLSSSNEKLLDSVESENAKDNTVLNALEMSQSMSSLSSKNIKFETSVEAHGHTENPLDMSKSMSSISSRLTHLESNNKVSPNELRTSISSSASVILRSTTHMPVSQLSNPIINNSSQQSSLKTSPNQSKLSKDDIVPQNIEDVVFTANGTLSSDATPEQLLIAQLNERVANLEKVVEAQEARFTAALNSLSVRLARETELRGILQAEIQKLERCVTRV